MELTWGNSGIFSTLFFHCSLSSPGKDNFKFYKTEMVEFEWTQWLFGGFYSNFLSGKDFLRASILIKWWFQEVEPEQELAPSWVFLQLFVNHPVISSASPAKLWFSKGRHHGLLMTEFQFSSLKKKKSRLNESINLNYSVSDFRRWLYISFTISGLIFLSNYRATSSNNLVHRSNYSNLIMFTH